jgi:hypothetical protein
MTAACAATAAWLLQCSPELHLLATSRERLGLPGEARQEVEPLAVPEAHDEQALDRLGAVESVRLFVQRTQDRRPDFALAPANAAARKKSRLMARYNRSAESAGCWMGCRSHWSWPPPWPLASRSRSLPPGSKRTSASCF